MLSFIAPLTTETRVLETIGRARSRVRMKRSLLPKPKWRPMFSISLWETRKNFPNLLTTRSSALSDRM